MSAQNKDKAAETAADLLDAIRAATANAKNQNPKQLKSLAKAYALVATNDGAPRAARKGSSASS